MAKRLLFTAGTVIIAALILAWCFHITRFEYQTVISSRTLPLITKIDRLTGKIYLLAYSGDEQGKWILLIE